MMYDVPPEVKIRRMVDVHLRDRDAHIANLEEQLRPHIGRQVEQGEQGVLA